MWPGDVNDVMHWKHVQRILGIWEKSESWVLASEEEGWLSELAEALWRVPHVVWGRWKSQHRKVVYLSPCVEKPFNSKVIKSFVPELRSRKGFLCFGIPMLSLYELWTFYIHFTRIRIMGKLHVYFSLSGPTKIFCTHTHTHTYIYIYIYIFFVLNKAIVMKHPLMNID